MKTKQTQTIIKEGRKGALFLVQLATSTITGDV